MSEKKEREEKERAQRERIGVQFLYNSTTQAFVEKIRAEHKIKLSFAYDFLDQEVPKEAPEQLIDDIRKFIDEEWEPSNEVERLYLDRNDSYGKAKSFKREALKLGFLLIVVGLLPKKLISAFSANAPDPVADIQEFQERSLLKYIMTGEIEPFAPEISEYLFRINLSGEPCVVLLASDIASPDIAAAKFRKFFLEAFGKKKRPPHDPVRDSRWYEMQRAGMPIKDIADQWIEENEENFPEVGTNQYLEKKWQVDEYIEGRIKEFKKTIK
ncbi:MAG: hypothetical protein Q8L35_07065 [Actinomycetota bacterium]|nr:hypothetical protein [Actinomycetota bacterium]